MTITSIARYSGTSFIWTPLLSRRGPALKNLNTVYTTRVNTSMYAVQW